MSAEPGDTDDTDDTDDSDGASYQVDLIIISDQPVVTTNISLDLTQSQILNLTNTLLNNSNIIVSVTDLNVESQLISSDSDSDSDDTQQQSSRNKNEPIWDRTNFMVAVALLCAALLCLGSGVTYSYLNHRRRRGRTWHARSSKVKIEFKRAAMGTDTNSTQSTRSALTTRTESLEREGSVRVTSACAGLPGTSPDIPQCVSMAVIPQMKCPDTQKNGNDCNVANCNGVPLNYASIENVMIKGTGDSAVAVATLHELQGSAATVSSLKRDPKYWKEWKKSHGAPYLPLVEQSVGETSTSMQMMSEVTARKHAIKISAKDISIERKIGGGKFGDVYVAKWVSEKVAVKQLKLRDAAPLDRSIYDEMEYFTSNTTFTNANNASNTNIISNVNAAGNLKQLSLKTPTSATDKYDNLCEIAPITPATPLRLGTNWNQRGILNISATSINSANDEDDSEMSSTCATPQNESQVPAATEQTACLEDVLTELELDEDVADITKLDSINDNKLQTAQTSQTSQKAQTAAQTQKAQTPSKTFTQAENTLSPIRVYRESKQTMRSSGRTGQKKGGFPGLANIVTETESIASLPELLTPPSMQSETQTQTHTQQQKQEKWTKMLRAQKELFAEIVLANSIPYHPNLVRYFGFVENEAKLSLVMQYMHGGSVQSYCYQKRRPRRKLTCQQVFWILGKACSGIKFLHNFGLIHRDIAARNILLGKLSKTGEIESNTEIKIGDFGMTRILLDDVEEDDNENDNDNDNASIYTASSANRSINNFGPFRWMAPESIQMHVYGEETDVYMFGMTMYEIMKRERPFDEDDSIVTVAAKVIQKERPDTEGLMEEYQYNAGIYHIIHLARQCWQHDANKRPTFEQISQIIKRAHQESNPKS